MVVSLPFGIVSPWCWPGPLLRPLLLNALVLLPLVLPPVVTGYVLLLLFGRQGPIGRLLAEQFGIVFAFRWTGAALACAIMGFPLMVRAIQLSLEAVDRRLEQAAGTLGANPALRVPHRDAAAVRAGHHRRRHIVLRPRHGRVRRHHHLRLEYPGRDADAADADLHLHPSPGRRGRRAQADADLGRHLARRHPRLRGHRAAGQKQDRAETRDAPAQGMTATPQGSRPTGTDFSAFRLSTSITVMSLVRPLAT